VGGVAAPSTIAYRVKVWTTQYFPTIESNVLTGYGPKLPPGSVWQYTESFYIALLLRGGLPLLAIYLWLMRSFVNSAKVAERSKAPVDSLIGRVLLIVSLLLLPMQFVDNYFIYPGIGSLIWIMAGLALASSRTNVVIEARPLGYRHAERGAGVIRQST
jgi:hypothetical protein